MCQSRIESILMYLCDLVVSAGSKNKKNLIQTNDALSVNCDPITTLLIQRFRQSSNYLSFSRGVSSTHLPTNW